MDRFEKFVLKITEATQLSPEFRQALTEDFETFTEEEYCFIREQVLSRLDEANIRGFEEPVQGAKKAHYEISQIIEADQKYVKSKVRKRALSVFTSTVDTFNEDLEKEKELNAKIINSFQNGIEEIPQITAQIIELLSQNEDEIQTVHIATSMYQLGDIIKKSDEVFIFDESTKAFITKITGLILKCRRNFNEQEVGSMIYALQNLPDCPEVRALIDAISDSIEHYKPELGSQCLSMSFYGLQNLGESPEVFRFVKILHKTMQDDPSKVDHQTLANAFYGLQNIINSDELRMLKARLLSNVENIDLEKISPPSLLSLVQAFKIIGLTLPSRVWIKYNEHINTHKSRVFASEWEKKVFNCILERFKYYYPSHNYYVDGFELDIYFKDLKINIELDGPHHCINSPHEERRDKHLMMKHGITILRIPCEIVDSEENVVNLVSSFIRRPL